MDLPARDAGIIAALIERLETQRLPRALDLKRKVDSGGTLDEFDMRFLEDVFTQANAIWPLLQRHVEHAKAVERVIHLYNEITEKALENER